jgi:hypothetical protein
MLDIKINFSYINGLPMCHFTESGEALPSSYAVAWCMAATLVYRIFTKEDMKEFLFRLAVTLHSVDLLENWLMDDRLMNYTVKEKPYVLHVEDIAMHFGLEIIDAKENLSSRDDYFKNVTGGIMGAMVIGAFEGFSVIKTGALDNNGIDLSVAKGYTPEITSELIAKAEFFARDIMKFIPEDIFVNRSAMLIAKEKELQERQERIEHLPFFDITKISPEIIRQCLEIMYNKDYVRQLLTDSDEFERVGRPMIYLAWLWANDFMESDGINADAKEGFAIDYNDYELEDGGFNLLTTIEDYNFNDMVPLLKGLCV